MEQKENVAELNMQELIALINTTKGDFIYEVSLGGEGSDGKDKSSCNRKE